VSGSNRLEGGARGTCGGKGLPVLINQPSGDQQALASGKDRFEGGARGTCGGKGLPKLAQSTSHQEASERK
jgi:hypothetical protein